jgi:hypothetical protein
MKHVLYLSFLSVLLLACNNQDQQRDPEVSETPVDSSLVKTGTELPENTVALLANDDVFSTDSEAGGVKWNNFKLTKFWKEDSPLVRQFQPEEGFFETYGQFLIYSPDSSRFIDLDSYNVTIRRAGNGNLVGDAQGPDTEISLVDRKRNEKTRLLFFGPGGSIEDAKWVDNENLLLIGTVESGRNGELNAGIFRYNIPTKSFQVYETADPQIVNKLKGYSTRERLKQVNMR